MAPPPRPGAGWLLSAGRGGRHFPTLGVLGFLGQKWHFQGSQWVCFGQAYGSPSPFGVLKNAWSGGGVGWRWAFDDCANLVLFNIFAYVQIHAVSTSQALKVDLQS